MLPSTAGTTASPSVTAATAPNAVVEPIYPKHGNELQGPVHVICRLDAGEPKRGLLRAVEKIIEA